MTVIATKSSRVYMNRKGEWLYIPRSDLPMPLAKPNANPAVSLPVDSKLQMPDWAPCSHELDDPDHGSTTW